MAGTKGMETRRRIVELAAPVFNRQGYVGASLRDLTDATGLERGGIYNHFGSKEQLALEAYDFAMTRVTEHLARSQDDATDAPDRLVRMIRAFSESARDRSASAWAAESAVAEEAWFAAMSDWAFAVAA